MITSFNQTLDTLKMLTTKDPILVHKNTTKFNPIYQIQQTSL